MNQFLKLFIAKMNTKAVAAASIVGLSGVTGVALMGPSVDLTPSTPPIKVEPLTVNQGDLKFQVTPAQTKFVQNENDEIYLNVEISTPKTKEAANVRQSDLVLLIDRSGSMGGEKLQYAKEAIHTFIDHLNVGDRVAVMSFDDYAISQIPLIRVTKRNKKTLKDKVNKIGIGGGTNMGEGMLMSHRTLQELKMGKRAKRLIILSDGQANQGMRSQEEFKRVTQQITSTGAVVSTVGLGAGFDEAILGSIADHGMGNFTFVESLTNLATTLKKDLENAREQYASRTEVLIRPPNGSQMIDASGYPIEARSNGYYAITIGQLIEDSIREFSITLSAPSQALGKFDFGDANLVYTLKNNKSYQVKLDTTKLGMEIVPPSLSHMAVASVDKAVYRDVWISNNLGRLQKGVSTYLKKGDQDGAKNLLKEFKTRQNTIGKKLKVKLEDADLAQEYSQLEEQTKDAFVGSRSEQASKQNIYSKRGFSGARKAARKYKKKP